MFIDSTRIVIYESSVSKKETGPRRGSEGYIVGNGLVKNAVNNYLLDNILNKKAVPYKSPLQLLERGIDIEKVHMGSNTYFFYKFPVYFTKFGFEKKDRVEKKEVLNVFPIKKSSEENKIEDKPFLNKELINYIKKIYDNKYAIVIALPDLFSKPSNFLKNTVEFEAWATSVLKNNLLKLILATTGGDTPTGLFLDNPILREIFVAKTNATEKTIEKIIPSFKLLMERYKDKYKPTSILLHDLRVINNLMLKTSVNSAKKNIPISNLDLQQSVAENIWKPLHLNAKITRNSNSAAIEQRNAIHNMQQFLIKSWAKQVKCETFSLI